MSDTQFDGIVIGAGHNGLITAAYLAKAGLKIAVFEERQTVGGGQNSFPEWVEVVGTDRRCRQCHSGVPPFQGQEEFLDMQAARIAGQAAVAADDPVTGNHHGQGIPAVGGAYGSKSGGAADLPCDLPIGGCPAVRNIFQRLPYRQLESRTLWRQGQIEGGQASGEVGAELIDDVEAVVLSATPRRRRLEAFASILEVDPREAVFVPGQ